MSFIHNELQLIKIKRPELLLILQNYYFHLLLQLLNNVDFY